MWNRAISSVKPSLQIEIETSLDSDSKSAESKNTHKTIKNKECFESIEVLFSGFCGRNLDDINTIRVKVIAINPLWDTS